MPSPIPIRNVYFLLCYAWDKLEQGELVDISSLDSTELVDLFAVVLCDGLKHVARRGIEQAYESHSEELAGVRGRIDFSNSARRALFVRGRAICDYDELTSNSLANRIIKTTLGHLLDSGDLDPKIRKSVQRSYIGLVGIEEIALSETLFKRVRVNSNPRFYRFLLEICALVYRSLLVDETNGSTRFRDFLRDDGRMAKLFQAFLFNFVSRECRQWSSVRVENLSWRAASETDPDLTLLPRMQTDISLVRPGRYLIVDAKYYQETLSSYFGSEKVHSSHLYQLLSYLLNAPSRDGSIAEGMLIYPTNGRRVRDSYEIMGRKVSVCTVDLSQPWKVIDGDLRQLFQ